MFSMAQPKFLIKDIIKLCDSVSKLREILFSHGIKSKEYTQDDLMIIYHNYSTSVSSDLQRECRSLVLKMSTLEIVSYSCESPLLNTDGYDYIKSNTEIEIVSQCYEGSCLSIFYHNNKWYISSRKFLNTLDSDINSEQYNKMYNLFVDVIVSSGYESFDDFTNKLDVNNSYYMVLVHHDNKHIINYNNVFKDENYKKLVLISIKDKNMSEIINTTNDFLNDNIFLPELDTVDNFLLNECMNIYNTQPYSEGIVVNKWDNKMNKFKLIKMQCNNYIYHSLSHNSLHSSLYLYQINKLYKSLDLMEINTTIKICASEIMELFKLMWDLQTGNQLENNIYNKLSKEYKYIMFKVKGVYYKNKKLLRINDIYILLKRIPVSYLISLLKSRPGLDEILSSNENIQKYNTTLNIEVYKNFINRL
jgi:hypothetical protein